MRIRSIKPEFFKHDELGAMPASHRILFIGLWCMADCVGRLEDRPKRIKVEVLPYDDLDVDAALTELATSGLIIRYEIGGQKLIEIVSFARHQRITGKEAEQDSRFPAPETKPHKRKMGKQRGNNGETPETTGDGREGKGDGDESESEKSEPEIFVAAWNQLPDPVPKVRAMTADRLTSLRTRLRDEFWKENWRPALDRIRTSAFCLGKNDRGWIADVEFFLRPSTVAKIMEGKYDAPRTASPSVPPTSLPSSAERYGPST